MAPYYAALVSSAHGQVENTSRHLVLLAARWQEVARAAASEHDTWTQEAASGRTVVQRVASAIETARRFLPGDVSSAHAELERIRLLLKDARASHGIRTLDDALTDYHEAMERLTSQIGGRNEVALASDDFSAIRGRIERARAAWSDVQSQHDSAMASSRWRNAAAANDAALEAAENASARRDAAAAQKASEALKSRYFDLLTALSHGA